jgi:glutamate dehydrogenase/leucine dehydrogenase
MIHAITWALVLTSGAGMSRWGPMMSWICCTKRRVRRSCSRGVVMALEEYLKDARLGEIRGKTFAVQGFGNVGSWTCRFLHDKGGRVVGIGDAGGAVHNADGLDVPALLEHVQATRWVKDFAGGEAMTNEALLLLDVDVLVPAALGGVITETNAPEVRSPTSNGRRTSSNSPGTRTGSRPS